MLLPLHQNMLLSGGTAIAITASAVVALSIAENNSLMSLESAFNATNTALTITDYNAASTNFATNLSATSVTLSVLENSGTVDLNTDIEVLATTVPLSVVENASSIQGVAVRITHLGLKRVTVPGIRGVSI